MNKHEVIMNVSLHQLAAIESQVETLYGGNYPPKLTQIESGARPASALLVPLLWAAALILPSFRAPGGVLFSTLYSFNGTNDGANPTARLVLSNDGNFYGVTGGSAPYNGNGTVFKINTNGTLTTLYSFSGGSDGGTPNGLVQGRDGNLYGTTDNGGTNGNGTVFRINTVGTLTTLHSFSTNDGPNGYSSMPTLVQGGDGNFYGTTSGKVFKISTNGIFTTLHAFEAVIDKNGVPTGEVGPQAALVEGSDGDFYGTTAYLGVDNRGTVFKISSSGQLSSLYSFSGTNDGAYPYAALVRGSDGNLYGTTSQGPTITIVDPMDVFYGYGEVFKISADGRLTVLYSFTGANDGANPYAGLIQGSDGYFYGTTSGGRADPGAVFRISAQGALTTLHSFTGGSDDGRWPMAGLVQGSDGNFYGTTSGGGPADAGTVFRLTVVPDVQAIVVTNGTLSLSWATQAGGTYQLQYTSDLSSINWTSLVGAFTATASTFSTTDYVTNSPRRFYRLVLLP